MLIKITYLTAMCRQSFMNFQLDSEPRTTYYGTADFDIWQKMVTISTSLFTKANESTKLN